MPLAQPFLASYRPSFLPFFQLPPPAPPADLAALAHSPGDASVAVAAERRRTSGGAAGHDHLGTPRMLSSLEGKPELLLPHLQALRLGDDQGASPGR
jgi:hypothetical protein